MVVITIMAFIKAMRIAFGFRARVGKDTAVEYLLHRFPCGIKLSFADPLYKIQSFAQLTCGLDPVKDRNFLQWVGTDWARRQNPNVWIDVLNSKLEKVGDSIPIFISDLRFLNETLYLKSKGFKLVQIFRSVDRNEHISETELYKFSNWDYVLANNSSIEEYHKSIDLMLAELFPQEEQKILLPELSCGDVDLLRESGRFE